jgi:hypothetical protein
VPVPTWITLEELSAPGPDEALVRPEFVAVPTQSRSLGDLACSAAACTFPHVTQTPAAFDRRQARLSRTATPPQPKLLPSSEREGRRRERRHEERLVADWLRSLASARA